MKDVNGIQTPYDQMVVPVPGTSGDGVRESDGLPIPDGVKGSGGEVPEVTTVDVRDADNPGLTRPGGMAGS